MKVEATLIKKKKAIEISLRAAITIALIPSLITIASCTSGPRSPNKAWTLPLKKKQLRGEAPKAIGTAHLEVAQQMSSRITSVSQNAVDDPQTNGPIDWNLGGAQKMTRQNDNVSSSAQWENGRLSFSFENAPIAAVAEAVLHGGLGLGYTIDPEVSGNVTLRTSRALRREDVIASLDRALWIEGAALVQNSDGSFLITTIAKSPSVSPPPRTLSSEIRGGGTVIVPLQYVSVDNIASILDGLGQKGAIAKIDQDRQLIILRGSESTLRNTVETINLFDVDWLKSASFRFYEIKWTDPDTLIAELTALIGGENGPIGRQVDFVSLPRLNGFVVISKRPERQIEISEWIARLDRPARGGNERRLFHRWIVNQDAEVMAETLNKLFRNVSQNQVAQSRRNDANQSNNNSDNGQVRNDAANEAAPANTGRQIITNRNSATENANQSTGGNAERLQNSQNRLANNSRRSQDDETNSLVPSINADAATNALLIYATDDDYRQIEEIVDKLDIAPDQVMIEATIAEVVLNDQLKFGVQWFIDRNNGHSFTFSSGTNNTTPSEFPGFSYRFVGTDARAVLNALSQVTDVSVVSTPQIMTLDNKTATLQVGDQVPIITQSAQGTTTADSKVVNSIQYRDTGILLTVTPRISSGENVLIDASQEVSEVAGTSSSGIDSPTIQQRRFQTSVLIKNGSTIALGGLIRTRKSVGDTRVPYIGAVPLLGSLFRTRDNSVRRTELIVFLTPHIIRSDEDANEATAQLRARLQRIRENGTLR